jgi:hypothetical protein
VVGSSVSHNQPAEICYILGSVCQFVSQFTLPFAKRSYTHETCLVEVQARKEEHTERAIL